MTKKQNPNKIKYNGCWTCLALPQYKLPSDAYY